METRYEIYELPSTHHLSDSFSYAILDNERSGRALAYCRELEDAKIIKAALTQSCVLDKALDTFIRGLRENQ